MFQMCSINNSQSSARSLRGMLGVVVRLRSRASLPHLSGRSAAILPRATGKGAAGRVAESSPEPFPRPGGQQRRRSFQAGEPGREGKGTGEEGGQLYRIDCFACF